MAVEFGNKTLTKTHHLAVAFAFGREIRAALGAAQRQAGKGVFECLFKSEKFRNRQIHRLVKAQPALIGADGAVVLDAKAAVDANAAVIVNPGNPKDNRPFRLEYSLERSACLNLWHRGKERIDRLQKYPDDLKKLGLVRVFTDAFFI